MPPAPPNSARCNIAQLDVEGHTGSWIAKNDRMRVSGLNVYPNEVEDVLAVYPEIGEAAVIGVPGDVKDEAVKATVVRKQGDLQAAQIAQYWRA